VRRLRGVCLLLAAAAVAAPAFAFDLGDLMQAMGRHRERHGRFVETKHLAVLNKPLRSSGEVLYLAPSLFEKRTLEPAPELLRVEGDMLYVEQGGKKYSVSLASQPQAAAFVDAVVGLLTGNADILQRTYQYELTGSAKKWTLTLVPTDPKMLAIVTRVVASGDQDQVRSIEYQQADGDSSTMVIEPLSADSAATH
jgi:hypothetical protein